VYHRTHLGLSQDTAVHYCILPARPSPDLGAIGGPAPELVISPFSFETWDQLWRLTTAMTDKPGLLYEISDTMRAFGVNILAAESATMEERGMFHVEMILHIPDEQQVAAVEWTLLARLFSNIGFLPSGNPRIRIGRLRNLWRVKQAFDRMSLIGEESRSVAFRPHRDKTKVEPATGGPNRPRSLRLRLPSAVREILLNTVASPPDWGYHLRISDTKDRFLRVLYFSNTDPVLHARVEHDDQIGSFASITGALRDANLTLLTGLTTPSEVNDRAFSEFVVRAVDAENANAANIKAIFERALAASPSARDLAFKVGYPSGYAAAWEKKSLRPLAGSPPAAAVQAATTSSNAWEALRLHHQNLSRLVQDGSLSIEDKHRWLLSNRLLGQHARITRQREPGSLFISCHYVGNHLDVAKRTAQEVGFTVITGENLEHFPQVVGGLIEKIHSCSNFLGIWSEAGAQRLGDECSPSPWLLWELGVASAFKLNWRLLIAKAIRKDVWSRLDASRQHVLYDESNFESRLRVALAALSVSSADDVGAHGLRSDDV